MDCFPESWRKAINRSNKSYRTDMTYSRLFVDGFFNLTDQLCDLRNHLTFGRQSQVLAVFDQRALRLIHAQQNVSRIHVSFSEVGFELQRHTDRSGGFCDLIHVPVKPSESEVALPGFFVQFQSIPKYLFRIRVALLTPVDFAQCEFRNGVLRLYLNGAEQRFFCFVPFAKVHKHSAEQKIRFKEI